MSSQTRLGGFKVLKDVAWLSLTDPGKNGRFPAELCHLLAREKLNLLFLACGKQDQAWGLNIAVDFYNLKKVLGLIENKSDNIDHIVNKSVILSLFPHKSDPKVTGALLNVLGESEIEPKAMAYSSSAISVVLPEDALGKTTEALFEPFQFGPYRTSSDWKLAQKGKEKVFKEIVASYQEKRPKVYSLDWQAPQELLRVNLNARDLGLMSSAFKKFAHLELILPFLISSPSNKQDMTNLFFCLPEDKHREYNDLIKDLIPEAIMTNSSSVAVFQMNGPHFGDRYGIAAELLKTFDNTEVELLALGCAVASINGVVPADQVEAATAAIKQCFEVPTITIKDWA